jgi:hypothetical protein
MYEDWIGLDLDLRKRGKQGENKKKVRDEKVDPFVKEFNT